MNNGSRFHELQCLWDLQQAGNASNETNTKAAVTLPHEKKSEVSDAVAEVALKQLHNSHTEDDSNGFDDGNDNIE